MASDVTVREARPEDVDAIRRVAEETWHETYDDILGADTVADLLEEWYAEEAIADGIGHEEQHFYVAVGDGEAIGYAHAGPHPPRHVFYLYRLYVHPDEWRAGSGKQLLAAIEQDLFDRDADAYEAEVIAENDVAVSFFESAGFERTEESERTLAGVTVDEYQYRKPL